MVNRKIEVGGMVASWWQPLASAIVNGLLVATIMTLLLTPAMLLLPEILKNKFSAESLRGAQTKLLAVLHRVTSR
jgi:multidrug efflux pump